MPSDVLPTFDLDNFRLQTLTDPLVRDIWQDKYRYTKPDGTTSEHTVEDTRKRSVAGVYARDRSNSARNEAFEIVTQGYFTGAGRVLAGAGTGRRVTMINCFVSDTIQDSMPGIQWAIARAALTMQQGGGIGVDYSTIRPRGALVKRTDSVSDGVIVFADQQDAMCGTISSAGTRRGAQMLTLRDDHPDLWNPQQFEWETGHNGQRFLKSPSFISAKRQPGRLTKFNVSVLVSDAFMRAVENDDLWDLGHHSPPRDMDSVVAVYDKPFPYDAYEMDNEMRPVSAVAGEKLVPTTQKGEMRPWYVYRRVKARTIWEDIIQSTYKYAEPGVLFIDRINARNNLYYCEEIRCTNPCGEQPLPPNGACDLGSVNLAFLVKHPFTDGATVDWESLQRAIHVGVRFLDNVLDTTNFPLDAQKQESDNKRRIGLGITGFADMLIQLRLRYGSPEAVRLNHELGDFFRNEAYRASIELAKERGPFPLFDAELFLDGYNVQQLPENIRADIRAHGIRNGVLTTIAPNGTISIYIGNTGSGHEPVFTFKKGRRKVVQADGSLKEYDTVNYAYRMYEAMFGPTPLEELPAYFVDAGTLTVAEHLAHHAAWQHYIDSSISKTINCPTEMTFAEFQRVYFDAYEQGCKGCTTYRLDPDSGRGSVLSVAEDKPEATDKATQSDLLPPVVVQELLERPDQAEGMTYKIRWGSTNYYVTINHTLVDGKPTPVEIFINSKDISSQEWIAALTRTISAIFRRGGNLTFLVDELNEVHGTGGGYFVDARHCPSIVAAIGRALEKEFVRLGLLAQTFTDEAEVQAVLDYVAAAELPPPPSAAIAGATRCPACGKQSFVRQQGCKVCVECGHTACG